MPSLNDIEARVIGAMLNPNYTYGIRTIIGISRETGLSREDIISVFNGDKSVLFDYSQSSDKARLNKSRIEDFSPDQLNTIGRFVMSGNMSEHGHSILPEDFVEGEEI